MKKTVILALALALGLASCSPSNGTLRVMLTDAPGLPESLVVVITEIAAHATGGGWESVSSQSRSIDLIRLLGQQQMLADLSLDPGTYTEIRLVVASGFAIVGGQSYPLVVPSSEVRIPARFDIVKGDRTEVLLDFDAEKSLEVHPTGGGSVEYILRPVVTLAKVTI